MTFGISIAVMTFVPVALSVPVIARDNTVETLAPEEPELVWFMVVEVPVVFE